MWSSLDASIARSDGEVYPRVYPKMSGPMAAMHAKRTALRLPVPMDCAGSSAASWEGSARVLCEGRNEASGVPAPSII